MLIDSPLIVFIAVTENVPVSNFSFFVMVTVPVP